MSEPIHEAARAVLVTGASSGLGEHFAHRLARSGFRVALAARRVDRLRNVVDKLQEDGGIATAVEMDVTDERSVQAGFDTAEAAIGPIETLIANAGISNGGPSTTMSVEDFDRIFSVNVRGVFLTAREAARRMMARHSRGRTGRIVLVSSTGGLRPLPGLAGYSASKAAVVMLGQGFAREWINRGVNVNVLCPGYIGTELTEAWFESPKGQKQIDGFPRKRLMVPADLDTMLLYLADEASGAITGSIFKLDDGQSL